MKIRLNVFLPISIVVIFLLSENLSAQQSAEKEARENTSGQIV
jgi:hypothetical protein